MKRSCLLVVVGFISLLSGAMAAGQAPREKPAVENPAEEAIDFDRARQLLRKSRGGEKLTPDEEAYLQRAREARQKQQRGASPARTPRAKVGLTPLTEMTADDRYQGQDGGLYGGGTNAPPAKHREAALAAAAGIEPLDANGKPAADGAIVLVSISMSNATQEFSMFKRIADSHDAKSPQLTIVDCAQGGQAMAEWASPEAPPWREAKRRLQAAGVTPEQVQVAWIKLANKAPQGSLEEHGRKLQRDMEAVIQNAKAKFPNLKIAYLSSRIYAGYATGALNPEPYAYESAFVVRWLIQDQIDGDPALNYDPDRGAVKAPVLLWGPYLWADGVTPRKSDGLIWTRGDLAGDGVHPSQSGREKVAHMLLDFFQTDETAKSWFTK
ncbi:MAG: hypothetical protein KY475_01430 [Planctomycetes bacterium]|nr:hypothetical protein [Planctomycetota bacterium]